MSNAIAWVSFGTESEAKTAGMAESIEQWFDASGSIEVLSSLRGKGTWDGETEFSGAVQISLPADRIDSVRWTLADLARAFNQDAIGFVVQEDGRTCVDRTGAAHTAEELFAPADPAPLFEVVAELEVSV